MRADVRSRIKAFVRGGARTAPLAVACTTRARILGRETLIAPTARRTGCVPETSIQGLVPGRVAPRGELERAALRRPRGARLIGHALLARHIPHALVLKAEVGVEERETNFAISAITLQNVVLWRQPYRIGWRRRQITGRALENVSV